MLQCVCLSLLKASSLDGMDAEVSGDALAESDLVVADIPEGQKPLICVEYPGE